MERGRSLETALGIAALVIAGVALVTAVLLKDDDDPAGGSGPAVVVGSLVRCQVVSSGIELEDAGAACNGNGYYNRRLEVTIRDGGGTYMVELPSDSVVTIGQEWPP